MTAADALVLPRYRQRSLSDVLPSLLAALGVPGFVNYLDVPAADSVCLLMVDGLGWELLREHAEHAPFLAALAARTQPLTAGFPATTAVSVASLGTGRPPGEHGIVGLSFALPGHELLQALAWRAHGTGKFTDLRGRLVPEQVQPIETAFERAAAAGVEVTVAAPAVQRGSGLTRAVLRGGRFRTTHALGDLAATAIAGGSADGPAFCYAYHGDLDLVGHVHGPGTHAWRLQLAFIDRLAETIAAGLPAGALLAVTADHGMVTLAEDQRVDADTEPALREGVRLLGGDIRARHVYAEPGAAEDVLAAWRDTLAGQALVVPREQAIAEGWFGPTVRDEIRSRIGDVLTASLGDGGVLRTEAEPVESRLIGQHGSLTAADQYVPFLLAPSGLLGHRPS